MSDTNTNTCPTCQRPGASHIVGDGEVQIVRADPADPFDLLSPAPEPYTREERAEAIRDCDELVCDGMIERMEATIRYLEWRLDGLEK